MISELSNHRGEIADLCREFGVRKLDVFGSASTGDFDPERSDIDFVIDFDDYGRGVARRFVAFGDELERLLGRKVDFVFEERMKPRFREAVDETREVVFEQGDRKVAACYYPALDYYLGSLFIIRKPS